MKILYVTPLWSGFKDLLFEGNQLAKGMPAFIQPLKRIIEQGNSVDFVITHSNIKHELKINVNWLRGSRFTFIQWEENHIKGLRSSFLLYKTIDRMLKQENYDFVYGHGSVGTIANIVANKSKVPFGLRLYGTFLAPELKVYSSPRLFSKHPLEYLAYRLNKSFLLMTNDGTRGDEVYNCLKGGSYSFYFWLNGLDCSINRDEQELDPSIVCPYLVYPARISKWKRQHLALDLIKILIDKGLIIHLYFAGHITEPEYWSEIQNRICELDLNDYVHYLGTVDATKLININENAVAVLSFYDYSNLGNVVIEALTQGATVLSLNDGSLHNVIIDGNNGFLVDTMQQAAERIYQLMKNPQLSNEIRLNAKNQATLTFNTWDQRAELEIELIKKAIRTKQSETLSTQREVNR